VLSLSGVRLPRRGTNSINSVDLGGNSDSFFRDAFNLGGNGGGGGGGGSHGGNNGALSGWSDGDLVPVGLLDKRFNASESGTTIATEKAKKWWEGRPQEVGDVKVCMGTFNILSKNGNESQQK